MHFYVGTLESEGRVQSHAAQAAEHWQTLPGTEGRSTGQAARAVIEAGLAVNDSELPNSLTILILPLKNAMILSLKSSFCHLTNP